MTSASQAEAPTLALVVKAELVSSNLAEFRTYVREALSAINQELVTDEDFGQAESDAKSLKTAEDNVRTAKEQALAQAEQVYAALTELDDTAEEIRQARLGLEKKIDAEKERRKTEMIEAALATYDIDPRTARQHFLPGLQTAIKGKRTLDSMRTALNVYATTTQAIIRKSRELLESFEKAHGATMIQDKSALELRKPEELEIELRRRFEAKKAEEERQKLAEEAAKAKAEADAARKEMEEAKRAPDPKPERLPKPEPQLTSPPSEAEEWAAASREIIAAFAPIKALKEKLLHSKNQAKLQGFGAAVNRCWEEWK